jgi:hypothetical protein
MSIERIYYCEGPDCGDEQEGGVSRHARTATPPPHLPVSFIETRERLNGEDYAHHFCSWDCLMKFAARQPIPEVIEMGGSTGTAPT